MFNIRLQRNGLEKVKINLWDDSDLKIDWPLNKLDLDQPLISEKNSAGLTIKQAEKLNLFFNENFNHWFMDNLEGL